MSEQKNVKVEEAIVLEQATEVVNILRAIELPDTGFGPQVSIVEGNAKPWNFGIVKARKALRSMKALQTFVDKYPNYEGSPRVKETKEAPLTQEQMVDKIAEQQKRLAKYSK